MDTPENLLYSSDHEWIQSKDGEAVVVVGITDFAQDALGDIVYVDLPEVGQEVSAKAQIAEVESTKSVSDIYAPVSGKVSETNSELADTPEQLNSDPYGDGWLFKIEMSDATELASLLDAKGYIALTEV